MQTKHHKNFKKLNLLRFALLPIFAINASWASPYAYVPNEKSGTISIIDCATDKVIDTIPAGSKPRGLAVTPDGKTLYVSDQPANALQVIDLRSRKITGAIALGERANGSLQQVKSVTRSILLRPKPSKKNLASPQKVKIQNMLNFRPMKSGYM